ncbi:MULTISPECIES: glycosyltransferase family 2 protein [Vibrio]|uniref:glycosyltransferase family 2 protein n=1 Tax=Vibrio TaxID=662 RepID=UPI001CDD83EA|nr:MULTISPECIES: glycosyltransferase family 2 protein [Vibrio]MCA2458817.1 glycosyltransferase family 2 protein [Vibrio alginolyticus]MCA2464429.1 glycosyltransferase family 2 protein [Vibrio alginolyticus]MDW2270815.1 glycosyltransferase family 2 protein [Vibrio sp. 1394]MDW2297718.1 glycosyltransferase family 2 protein [Vibrio sp. 1404]
MKLGIAAIFKNEFEFIIEWVCYHRLLGVDKFYIADNVSDDGSSELLQILDYLGYIKRIHFPRVNNIPPQAPAYNFILKEYGNEVDLLAFIDADEFIVCDGLINENKIINDFYRNETLSAMGINWKIYGSSNKKLPSLGLVTKDFVYRSEKTDLNCNHIKSLIKPNKVSQVFIHDCLLSTGVYCNTSLEVDIFPDGASNYPKTNQVSYDNLHINHYVIKSRIDQFVKKMNKGSAAGSAKRKKGVAYFQAHDKNDVYDPFSSDFIEKLILEVNNLRKEIDNSYHFMPLCNGHVDVNFNNNTISGWISDINLDLVRITINEKEYIAKLDKMRNDVYSRGLSNGERCGFSLNIILKSDDIVDAYIYSSSLPLNKNVIEK